MHYQRWAKHGDPLKVLKVQVSKGFYKECTVENCHKNPHGKGLCDMHTKLKLRQETPEYSVWLDIKRRCYNENTIGYKNYGGRGIAVCDRWLHSFKDFYEDMGKRPKGDYSIERNDVNGNYEPSNCRWATRLEQANNKRNNRWVTIDGVTKTLGGWSIASGLPMSTLRGRYYVFKWPLNKLLTPKKG